MEALELHHAAMPEKTVVIVATHDCDLAQSPEWEPRIEVVVGCLTDKDGNCTHAKNARKLHVEFAGDSAFWGEFEATSKVTIDKMKLNQFAPRTDARLSTENHAIFQMWLASRYRRSAFPDEFERRLTRETKLADKIARAVKPHGELITGVFFDVDEGEEVTRDGPDDPYTLDITILHAADRDFDAAENAAQTAARTIERAFKEKLFNPAKKWQNIELRYCEPLSESTMTYQFFKQLKRWRLEHISLAADPQQPVLAE
ncbi:hypothetical protein LH435_09470 [Laribacter hongkongensis]|uniref:hypothetical protein n=1 Tax=Laribacter hongkongensis TaxID=168471 RepID=UPI001EFC4AF2|nr:hypothetical protein [Laribacter hongkongensis]MCG8996705.1 hypothetical protein [Laribacter hongkongensis]MCG9023308.1 hypothetical protein [Laribacter hongkongensis]MCG9047087.1 hypothetical protein [Laribacter hongkongensis]MCG9074223.1 hypothetical protein [Laribacter hongkongensis]